MVNKQLAVLGAGLAAVLAATPAAARDDKVAVGPPPEWVRPSALLDVPSDASGLVFVRRQDNLIHLDGKGGENYSGYRIRILHPNALAAGNLAIAWNPAAGTPRVHAIRVYRGEAVTDVLKTASFQILQREDRLEQATLDGTLTAVLHVPDLRVGDELEVAYTTPGQDPTLGNNSTGMLVLFNEPPPGRFRLGLNWTAGQEPQLKVWPLLTGHVRRDAGGIDVMLDNPAKVNPPKDAPLRFQMPRLIEYSDFPDWQAVSRTMAPLFSKAARLGAGSPLKAEAARIAAAAPDPAARAAAALQLVQREVRYVYVGLNGGNLTPADADTTWQRRYGDCKAKTALLLALLGELGIAAEPVLANNEGSDDGLDLHLPSPAAFDHVLVETRIGGVVQYLDGTLPPVAQPAARPVLPYRFVLPLTAAGDGLRQLEWRPAERPDTVDVVHIDARGGFEQPAGMVETRIVRGIEGLKEYVQFSSLTPAQLTDAFRGQLIGDYWQTIEAVKWRYDGANAASVLSITGTAKMDWERNGAALTLALPGGGFSPPDKQTRPADQDQSLPYVVKPEYDCRVTTLRLPSKATATNWSYATTYDQRYYGADYHRAMELRDGTVRMIRGLRTRTAEIDAAAARADNARASRFDNSKAWVTYDSTAPAARRTASAPVAAADEIDWVTNDSACLGAAAR